MSQHSLWSISVACAHNKIVHIILNACLNLKLPCDTELIVQFIGTPIFSNVKVMIGEQEGRLGFDLGYCMHFWVRSKVVCCVLCIYDHLYSPKW